MDRNAYSAVHCPPDFQGGGLVNKYVRQEFIALSQEEKDYTKRQTKYPWRYSFSTIVENPTEHVYEMLDIFRNHKYYLYSPAVTKFLKEYPARTFFYLIEFNGECWETYGPVSAYHAYDEDDIFYYATEHNPRIRDEKDLIEDVERNPVPYAMLAVGSQYPPVLNGPYEMVHVNEWIDLEDFRPDMLDKSFETVYKKEFTRLSFSPGATSAKVGLNPDEVREVMEKAIKRVQELRRRMG